jgi:phosphatidylserine decarboxylase
MKEIQYIDRKTKKVEIEKVYGHRALSLLYGNSFASRLFSWIFLPLISRVAFFSSFYGFLQKRASSQKKIKPFISTYGIDTSEFLDSSFSSFNDFFIRKLKKEKRPIVSDPRSLCMPADGRYLVFPDLRSVDRFYVKGQSFSISSFLQNSAYGRRYSEGSMVISRLCPVDYHRFHFVSDGIASASELVKGNYQSVNPIALRQNLSILWTNKRMITEIETERFGTILYCEVGAVCVGTIHQTYTPNTMVCKGDEKGYFSFGGSCLVLLFEKGRVLFDSDLVENSLKGFETRANFGESLGVENSL